MCWLTGERICHQVVMDTVKCNMSVLCCLRISDISSSLSTTELSVQPPPPPQPQHRLHHRQPGQQQVQCVGLRGPQPLRAEMVWRVTSRSSRHHLDKFPRRRRCWHRVMRSNKLYKPDSLTSYRLCWANWGRMLILHIPPVSPPSNQTQIINSDEMSSGGYQSVK